MLKKTMFLFVCLLSSCEINPPNPTGYLIALFAQWPNETFFSYFSYSNAKSIYTVGQKIQDNAPIVSGSVSSYKINSSLPLGLNLDTNSGIISGTPVIKQGTTTYTIQASNGNSSVSTSIQITIIESIAPISDKSNFVDNMNGTITDTAKGLTWMKCSQGQNWDLSTNNCLGSFGTYQYCSSQNESCNDTSTKLLNGIVKKPVVGRQVVLLPVPLASVR